jgi:thiol-disulfide isomerase/thioredoxin
MPQVNETVLAPALDGGEWIQHGPVNLKELRGKAVVLIDFWDYTCVNCIHTLPYVSAWHRRYGKDGLIVVGVHAPEFSFARDHANVRTAIKQFGLEYPVVLDNGYIIWRAYSNRYWPAKYLVDTQGKLRYYHFGEGFTRKRSRRFSACWVSSILRSSFRRQWNRCATATVPAPSVTG